MIKKPSRPIRRLPTRPGMPPADSARSFVASVKLTGSTHEQRAEELSGLLRRINPVTERQRFDAVFDAYLICLAFEQARQAASDR